MFELGQKVKITYDISIQGCIGRITTINPEYTVFVTDQELAIKIGKQWEGWNLWVIPASRLEKV